MTHEQDRERIEKAADNALEQATEGGGFLEKPYKDRYRFHNGFIEGIKWRDKNPSPEVRELVEATKELKYQLMRQYGTEEKIFASVVYGDIYKLILDAVARLEGSK